MSCNDETVKTSNLLSKRQQGGPSSTKQQVDRIGPLTFSPTPSLDDEDLQEINALANNHQAELMQWHFCLGHLPFNQLKELAKIGETPKKLAKMMPLQGAGCLFGAMTKLPW